MTDHVWRWKELSIGYGTYGDAWRCERCGVTFLVHAGGHRPEVYIPNPGLSDDCDVETVREVLES